MQASSRSIPMRSTATASSAPVLAWALLGVVATVFSLNIFGQWLLSETHFAPVAITAADAITDAQLTRIRVVEAISMLVTLVGAYWFLVRPWVRDGVAPIEGLLLIGALISYVFDTTINLTQYVMAWNKHAFNFGTWAAFFPGHTGPTAYAEALLWGPPMYVYFGIVLGALQLASLRFAQNRVGLGFWPALAFSFVVAYVFDLVVESQIIKLTEAYSWCFTIKALTLWPGEQHQFPLYEPFLVATFSTIYLSLLMSKERDPAGVSFIERGANRLPPVLRLPARLMAATAFATLTTMVYFGGYYAFTLLADSYASLPPYLLATEHHGVWPPVSP